jgi:DNA-binding LacI/PurR family transcriptional regulator
MATMADIAKRAGVSLSTVSYALSGKRPISPETRERIQAAIDELDFHPHQVGRALASRRSNTIAILYPSLSQGLTEMPLEFVVSAAEEATRHGYSLVLSTTPPEDEAMLRMTGRGFVDGLVLMEVKLVDPRVPLLRERGIPFAMIGHCADNTGLSFVDLDFEHAIATAVDYLADLGHPRIALVSRQRDLHEAGYGPSVRCEAGLVRAAAARSVEPTFRCCDANPIGGYDTTRALLAEREDLGAIISLNSEALGGIVRAVHESGLRIPDDVSILGLTSPRIAQLIAPALTTIDFPAAEMGRSGAELLIRRLEGGEIEPTQCLLRGKLTVRRSTGPYARTGRTA